MSFEITFACDYGQAPLRCLPILFATVLCTQMLVVLNVFFYFLVKSTVYISGIRHIVYFSAADSEFSTRVLCLPGAPSPAGHLSAAGIRREAGQHGYSRPRGRAQHHALRVPLPRGVQDAKAAYSHTA